MSGQIIDVNQRKVQVLESGNGTPLLYLHGFADVHSVKESWMPFHEQLAQRARVIAPAHPGCAQTDENKDIDAIEDVVFHYLEVLDALKLTQFDLVGSCVGGWIAAELAVRPWRRRQRARRQQRRTGRRSAPLSNAALELAHRLQAAVLLQPLAKKPVASNHVTDVGYLGRKRQLRAAFPRRNLHETYSE